MENKIPTKKCPHCFSDIPVKATKCPQCHADLRSWVSRHPILTFFIIIIMIPIFIGVINEDSSTTNPVVVEPQLSPEQLLKWQTTTPEGKICAKHPGWTKEECEGLANNKIWVDMTYDMLVYKRGKPDSSNPSNYGGKTQYQYCWHDYSPSCFYDDNGDKVMDAFN